MCVSVASSPGISLQNWYMQERPGNEASVREYDVNITCTLYVSDIIYVILKSNSSSILRLTPNVLASPDKKRG